MAFLKIDNVAIRGIAVCSPENVVENRSLDFFTQEEIDGVISMTGIERRRVADLSTTCSDLCEKAFNALIAELGWEKDSIDAIVYLSMTEDYPQPNTACVLHGRLGLSEDCYVMDIKQGCPGWIIGMSSLSALVSTGQFKRAVLLNGDINTRNSSPYDKESQPLFSDAGAVTAIEFDPEAASIEYYVATRGKDHLSILCPAGGARQPVTEESLQFKEMPDGSRYRDIDCRMDGMSVFSFGISVAPKAVKNLWEYFSIEPESIDKYFFHQANLFMNEKIRKKLKIDEAKVPYILKDFGNSSSASIPANIVMTSNKDFQTKKMDCIGCSFGVGLQYGAIHFVTDKIVCPDLILY